MCYAWQAIEKDSVHLMRIEMRKRGFIIFNIMPGDNACYQSAPLPCHSCAHISRLTRHFGLRYVALVDPCYCRHAQDFRTDLIAA